MTLVDFLTSRFDEDEAMARAAVWPDEIATWSMEGNAVYAADLCSPHRCDQHPDGKANACDDHEVLVLSDFAEAPSRVLDHVARHDPAHVLREVAAKRWVIEAWREAEASAIATKHREVRLRFREEQYGLMGAMRKMAAVYSDHPDYRGEWAT